MAKIIITTISKDEIKQLIEQTINKALRHMPHHGNEQSSIFLNVDQAADSLGIAKATLYGKCSKKLIPHFKKGKKLYFDQKELTKWLKSGKRKTIDDIDTEVNSYLGNRKIS